MSKNRIKLNICGTDYIIVSDEKEEYMEEIAKEIDEAMNITLKNNMRVSVTMAAVLTALRYCDESKKSMADADNLRTQIKDYLEESVEARMQADEARNEILKLEKEVKSLKEKLKRYDEILSEKRNFSEDSEDINDGLKPDLVFESDEDSEFSDELINEYIDDNQEVMDAF